MLLGSDAPVWFRMSLTQCTCMVDYGGWFYLVIKLSTFHSQHWPYRKGSEVMGLQVIEITSSLVKRAELPTLGKWRQCYKTIQLFWAKLAAFLKIMGLYFVTVSLGFVVKFSVGCQGGCCLLKYQVWDIPYEIQSEIGEESMRSWESSSVWKSDSAHHLYCCIIIVETVWGHCYHK